MILRIKDILEKLGETIIIKSVLCEENLTIRGVKLLTDHIAVFDDHILYIGWYSKFPLVSPIIFP